MLKKRVILAPPQVQEPITKSDDEGYSLADLAGREGSGVSIRVDPKADPAEQAVALPANLESSGVQGVLSPEDMGAIFSDPGFYLKPYRAKKGNKGKKKKEGKDGSGEQTDIGGMLESPEERRARLREYYPGELVTLRNIRYTPRWNELKQAHDDISAYYSEHQVPRGVSQKDEDRAFRDAIRWQMAREAQYHFPEVVGEQNLEALNDMLGIFPRKIGPQQGRMDEAHPTAEEKKREQELDAQYNEEVGGGHPFSLYNIDNYWLPRGKGEGYIDSVPLAIKSLDKSGRGGKFIKQIAPILPPKEGESDEDYTRRAVSFLLRMRDYQKDWEGKGYAGYGGMMENVLHRMGISAPGITGIPMREYNTDPNANGVDPTKKFFQGPWDGVDYTHTDDTPDALKGVSFEQGSKPNGDRRDESTILPGGTIPFMSIPEEIQSARKYEGGAYSDTYQKYMSAVLIKALMSLMNTDRDRVPADGEEGSDPLMQGIREYLADLGIQGDEAYRVMDKWFDRVEAPAIGEGRGLQHDTDLTSRAMNNVILSLKAARVYNILNKLSMLEKPTVRVPGRLTREYSPNSATATLRGLLELEKKLYARAKDKAEPGKFFTPEDGDFEEYEKRIGDEYDYLTGALYSGDLPPEYSGAEDLKDIIRAAVSGEYYIRGNNRIDGALNKNDKDYAKIGKLFKLPYALQSVVSKEHMNRPAPDDEYFDRMGRSWDYIRSVVDNVTPVLLPTMIHNRVTQLRERYPDNALAEKLASKAEEIAARAASNLKEGKETEFTKDELKTLRAAGVSLDFKSVLGTLLKDNASANEFAETMAPYKDLLGEGRDLADWFKWDDDSKRSEEGLLLRALMNKMDAAVANRAMPVIGDLDDRGYLPEYLATKPLPRSEVQSYLFHRPYDKFGKRIGFASTPEYLKKLRARDIARKNNKNTAKLKIGDFWDWAWSDGYQRTLEKYARGEELSPDELDLLRGKGFLKPTKLIEGGVDPDEVRSVLGSRGWTPRKGINPDIISEKLGENGLIAKLMPLRLAASLMGDENLTNEIENYTDRVAALTDAGGGYVRENGAVPKDVDTIGKELDELTDRLGLNSSADIMPFTDDWLALNDRLGRVLEGRYVPSRMSPVIRYASALRGLKAIPTINRELDSLKGDDKKDKGHGTDDDIEEAYDEYDTFDADDYYGDWDEERDPGKDAKKDIKWLTNKLNRIKRNLAFAYKSIREDASKEGGVSNPDELIKQYSWADDPEINEDTDVKKYAEEDRDDEKDGGGEVEDATKEYLEGIKNLDSGDVSANILAEIWRRLGGRRTDEGYTTEYDPNHPDEVNDAPITQDPIALLRMELGMDPYYELSPWTAKDTSEVLYGVGGDYPGGADAERALDEMVGARRRTVSDDDLNSIITALTEDDDYMEYPGDQIASVLRDMTGAQKTWPEWKKILQEKVIPSARQRRSEGAQEGDAPAAASVWDGLTTAERRPASKDWAHAVGYSSPKETDVNESALRQDLQEAYNELVGKYGSYDKPLGLGISFPKTFDDYLSIPRQLRTVYDAYLRNLGDEAVSTARNAWEQEDHMGETFNVDKQKEIANKALRGALPFDKYIESMLEEGDPVAKEILSKIEADHAKYVRNYRDVDADRGGDADEDEDADKGPSKRISAPYEKPLTSPEIQMLADERGKLNVNGLSAEPTAEPTQLTDEDKEKVSDFWRQLVANSRSGMPISKFLQEAGTLLRDLPVPLQNAILTRIMASPQDWKMIPGEARGTRSLPIMTRLRKSEQREPTEKYLEAFFRSTAELGHAPLLRVKKT